MKVPPTGTVTFLFTDIEGSTALWEDNPGAMPYALARQWGAANTLREVTGSPWLPLERRLHEPYLETARSGMDEGVGRVASDAPGGCHHLRPGGRKETGLA